MNWLKQRRNELRFTLDDLAAKLQLEGISISAGAISHWENNRHLPPLDDMDFRQALANSLKVDVSTLLKMAGYEVSQKHTDTGEKAAYLVDKLPPEKQKLALNILELLAEV